VIYILHKFLDVHAKETDNFPYESWDLFNQKHLITLSVIGRCDISFWRFALLRTDLDLTAPFSRWFIYLIYEPRTFFRSASDSQLMTRDVSARCVPARSNDSKCISSRLINEYVMRMNTTIRKRITHGYREGNLWATAFLVFFSANIRYTSHHIFCH